MDFLGAKIEDAREIVKRGIREFDPIIILAGFTSGSDSLTLLHLLMDFRISFHPVFCNPGIGVVEQWQYIRDYCKKQQLTLIEQTPVYKTYKQMVVHNGFPGPSIHTIMYSNLKQKSFQHLNRFYFNRAMIMSGVRLSESERRKINIDTAIYSDDKTKLRWVSPLINWTDDDKAEYLEHKRIELSPVSKCMGMSCECLCGSYAKKGELAKLQTHYPATAKGIIDLQNILFDLGFTWGWEDVPPTGRAYYETMERIYPGFFEIQLLKKEKKELDQGILNLFSPLCHKCETSYLLDRSKDDYLNEKNTKNVNINPTEPIQ